MCHATVGDGSFQAASPTSPPTVHLSTLHNIPQTDFTMTAEVFRSPAYLRPKETLSVSQLAPTILKPQTTLPYPLSLLLTAESQEKWQMYENILIACLKTGDDKSAFIALEGLTTRFGIDNERVQALQGLYNEAVAKDDAELGKVLKQYEKMIDEKPVNMPIRKRRVALLKSMGKTGEAVKALTELLDVSPTDAEAWSELADLYLVQGMLSQAVYCLEEVLLVTPNAWNVHARIGETTVLMANAAEGAGDKLKLLSEAMRRFCRCVELCDNYLRGFYGLKLVRFLSCSART